jgi:hypothetical protein
LPADAAAEGRRRTCDGRCGRADRIGVGLCSDADGRETPGCELPVQVDDRRRTDFAAHVAGFRQRGETGAHRLGKPAVIGVFGDGHAEHVDVQFPRVHRLGLDAHGGRRCYPTP